MAKTFTMSVDNLSLHAVTVQSVCRKVTIYENDQAGTTDWILAAPTANDAQITKPAGSKKEFERSPGVFWNPGDVVGYVKAVTGTITLAQEED